ncbi:dimethylarginine dimethylaminohydrolase family protein [Oceanobacillus saliphilus]|uniref:dimethylarginine dimethylaminohydrolase family protein n=1 Tax=Oceanobacillus saliphilus TaxID=2925834 RepID=UPI00201D672E|nr:dimethylarginine dimethylaminohydrolase family protein [Oceanobacillus saliphilus]
MNNATPRETTPGVKCRNEYDPLKQVIVVPPNHMKIKEVINVTQRHYLNENINIEKAMEQHRNFIHTLQSQGAHVIALEAKKQLNEQVFTRDIGFTIGNRFFVSSMKKDIRKHEESVLIDWLTQNNIPYYRFDTPSIEGGDVLVDNSKVWVGQSDRTTPHAIETLDKQLPDHKVTPIFMRKDILHLDCIFNVISEDTALIYSPAMVEDSYNIVKASYKLIEVTEDEQFHLGPNVLPIGNKKLISLPENKRLNEELTQAGFEVIEVPFSEIIKSGGSYRCCTLPLIRKQETE